MAYESIPVLRDQPLLLPPDLRDWLPEDHLAWFVLDAVAQMDLRPFGCNQKLGGRGRAPYNATMLASLLLYAYCLGERSSRKIEKLCEDAIAFRVIAANQHPDHTQIARFRQEHEQAFSALFIDVLRLCAEAGLVKVGVVALDGTKMKANAALSANRTRERLEKDVARMLSEATAKDAEEDARYGKDRRGDEMPQALRGRRDRLARLKECQERLDREAAEARREQAEKIAARAAEEAATGQKKRGRKPRAPEEIPPEESKANVTDPECRVMKTASGYVQGYNAQAATVGTQVIVAADVTDEANDVKQLHPMAGQVQENLAAVAVEEPIGVGLADAGYWSEANIRNVPPDGPEWLIATTKDWKQRKAARERPPPRGRIPKGLSARERMERKLLTKRGRALYRRRSQTVEPVFGQIKDGRGIDRFLRRGLSACRSEWRLICATHNLLKLWRSGKACWN